MSLMDNLCLHMKLIQLSGAITPRIRLIQHILSKLVEFQGISLSNEHYAMLYVDLNVYSTHQVGAVYT